MTTEIEVGKWLRWDAIYLPILSHGINEGWSEENGN